jgi:N-acetylated-alpha-linked acidic dipeptidase
LRDETKSENYAIANGLLSAVQNPKEKFVVPALKDEVPYLNFAPLQNALSKLRSSAKAFETASNGKGLSLSQQKDLDQILMKSEQFLLSGNGLPRRPWFRHQIYAPGFYTGYGVKTLPGVREAIEQRNWTEAAEQIEIVSRTIEGFAAKIDNAARLMANSKN